MTPTLRLSPEVGQRSQHVVICGDDGLAHRLALELDAVRGEVVTVLVPSRDDEYGAGIAALHEDLRSPVELLVSARPDERTRGPTGVERAAALALTYRGDQVNMTAAPLARTLNPSMRLVLQMFPSRAQLPPGAAAGPRGRPARGPVAGHLHHGAVGRRHRRTRTRGGSRRRPRPHPPGRGQGLPRCRPPGGTPSQTTDLATLGVLSGAHEDDPAIQDSAETPGEDGTQLLPDTRTAYHGQFTHGRLMLEEVTHHHAPEPARRSWRGRTGAWLRARIAHLPWRVILSREVTAVFGALAAMGRSDLTYAEWERLRPFLPVSNRRCGQWRDHWQVIDGSLHRVRTGVAVV